MIRSIVETIFTYNIHTWTAIFGFLSGGILLAFGITNKIRHRQKTKGKIITGICLICLGVLFYFLMAGVYCEMYC